MSYVIVYITFSNKEEAEKIAKVLVEKRLVAGANIIPEITSFFWWKGKLEEEKESALIAKTKKEVFDKLLQEVKKLHSYECPCVIALPIVEGSPDFLNWIDEEVQK